MGSKVRWCIRQALRAFEGVAPAITPLIEPLFERFSGPLLLSCQDPTMPRDSITQKDEPDSAALAELPRHSLGRFDECCDDNIATGDLRSMCGERPVARSTSRFRTMHQGNLSLDRITVKRGEL